MTIQGVKQNPEATKEDLRRMALILNDLVGRGNSGVFERQSSSSTGTTVNDDGLFSIYYVDATDGNVTFNLKSLIDTQDRIVTVKKLDGSTNTVAVTPSSTTQLIDGSTDKIISSQFVSHEFHARDLINWNII